MRRVPLIDLQDRFLYLISMNTNSGIAAGGMARLRKAIDEEVRREFQEKLSANPDHWLSVSNEERIAEEVKRRLSEVASAHSLWAE